MSDECKGAEVDAALPAAAAAASVAAASSSPVAARSLPAGLVSPSTPIYFEKQSLSRCALHTLNNLLQAPIFSVADLNAICKQLSPAAFVNPHKSWFGVGNWDVNVLMRALAQQGLNMRWWDRRKRLTDLPLDPASSTMVGFVVNGPSPGFADFGARHWFAIRRLGEGDQAAWWMMDSGRQPSAEEAVQDAAAAVAAPPLSRWRRLIGSKPPRSPASRCWRLDEAALLTLLRDVLELPAPGQVVEAKRQSRAEHAQLFLINLSVEEDEKGS